VSLSDPIADMLTRIRNGNKARLPSISMPSSNMKAAVAEVLKRAGYIEYWNVDGELKKSLTIGLKYTGGKTKEGVIEGIRRISKPSCRVYAGSSEIPRVLGGLGVAIVSTSSGLMTDREARKNNVGGEILCYVW